MTGTVYCAGTLTRKLAFTEIANSSTAGHWSLQDPPAFNLPVVFDGIRLRAVPKLGRGLDIQPTSFPHFPAHEWHGRQAVINQRLIEDARRCVRLTADNCWLERHLPRWLPCLPVAPLLVAGGTAPLTQAALRRAIEETRGGCLDDFSTLVAFSCQ